MIFFWLGTSVRAHGTIVSPPAYATGVWNPTPPQPNCAGLSCYFMTNYTFVLGSPTMPADSDFRTYPKTEAEFGADPLASRPWRAPGSAPVFGGCGVFGGNPHGCDGVPKEQGFPPQCDGAGSALGIDMAALESQGTVTTWAAGAHVEVKFGITANHGGGYVYRLCKDDHSEECFQETILDFVGDTQFVEFTNGTRIEFQAKRLSEGTTPPGSVWTMNPIPAYAGLAGSDPSMGTQFEPLHPLSPVGFGPFEDMTVVDVVRLPDDLEPGRYALSWRWDAEQTSQVWLGCSAIQIADDGHGTTKLGRRCGSSLGACGLECSDDTDPTSCIGFIASSSFTIQPSVCLNYTDADSNYTWFDRPDDFGICDADHLCGVGCEGFTDDSTCLIYLNNLVSLGQSRLRCLDTFNGTWINTTLDDPHYNDGARAAPRHAKVTKQVGLDIALGAINSAVAGIHRAVSVASSF